MVKIDATKKLQCNKIYAFLLESVAIVRRCRTGSFLIHS